MGDVSRDLFPERGCNNPEVIDFVGRFSLGTSPVVIAGRSYTVSYAATGLYTLTTLFQWKDFLGGGLYEMSATLTDAVQLVSFNAALRQIVLQYQRGGAASAAAASEQIGFNLLLGQKGLAIK